MVKEFLVLRPFTTFSYKLTGDACPPLITVAPFVQPVFVE
jgi:hypothetical protein